MTPPPAGRPLGEEVHVWWLDAGGPDPATYRHLLDDAERRRADRARTPQAYASFVLTRAALRQLLRRYSGRSEISFTFGPQGKPALGGAAGPVFNLSHCRTRSVLAFRRTGRIGIDVEDLREDVDSERLAARFFAPAEVDALARLPVAERRAGFFRCWARKEAFVKAVGDGLSHDLRSFAVSVDASPAALVVGPAEPWQLHDLDAGAGCVAALAVCPPVPRSQVRLARWPGDVGD